MLAVTDSRVESMTCTTRHSNPAPNISWVLADLAINTTHQNNTKEEGSSKWKSEATLEYILHKDDLWKTLQCLVKHPAYTSGENTTGTILDVLCK